MSEAQDFSVEMFSRSDVKDVDGWTALMTEDIHFVFGNGDPIDGRDRVREAIAVFFDSIKLIKHDVLEAWTVGDKLIQKLQVTYTRLDGGVLSVPAANILTRRDGLISEYLIYVDNHALYA
jgi:ketosteroid isomerase-like protein